MLQAVFGNKYAEVDALFLGFGAGSTIMAISLWRRWRFTPAEPTVPTLVRQAFMPGS
jgi:hypothetical protein